MQRFFPGLLDALLADHVGAAVVAQLAGALQILDVAVGDAADVTNHVGGRQALRILAHPAGAQFDAGKLEGMGGEPGRLGFIQVVAQLQAGVAAGLGRAALKRRWSVGLMYTTSLSRSNKAVRFPAWAGTTSSV